MPLPCRSQHNLLLRGPTNRLLARLDKSPQPGFPFLEAPALVLWGLLLLPVCTENSNPHIMVMKSPKDRA